MFSFFFPIILPFPLPFFFSPFPFLSPYPYLIRTHGPPPAPLVRCLTSRCAGPPPLSASSMAPAAASSVPCPSPWTRLGRRSPSAASGAPASGLACGTTSSLASPAALPPRPRPSAGLQFHRHPSPALQVRRSGPHRGKAWQRGGRSG
jgi:hypothetical protein